MNVIFWVIFGFTTFFVLRIPFVGKLACDHGKLAVAVLGQHGQTGVLG